MVDLVENLIPNTLHLQYYVRIVGNPTSIRSLSRDNLLTDLLVVCNVQDYSGYRKLHGKLHNTI